MKLIFYLCFFIIAIPGRVCIGQEKDYDDSKLFDFRSKNDERMWWCQLGLMAIYGTARGVNQVQTHKYNAFKARHPKANDNYCNPSLSYKRKYKNGDPAQGPAYFGSTTFLVATTDLWHLTDMISHVSLYVGCVIPFGLREYRGLRVRNMLTRYISLVGVNALFFNMTYDRFY